MKAVLIIIGAVVLLMFGAWLGISLLATEVFVAGSNLSMGTHGGLFIGILLAIALAAIFFLLVVGAVERLLRGKSEINQFTKAGVSVLGAWYVGLILVGMGAKLLAGCNLSIWIAGLILLAGILGFLKATDAAMEYALPSRNKKFGHAIAWVAVLMIGVNVILSYMDKSYFNPDNGEVVIKVNTQTGKIFRGPQAKYNYDPETGEELSDKKDDVTSVLTRRQKSGQAQAAAPREVGWTTVVVSGTKKNPTSICRLYNGDVVEYIANFRFWISDDSKKEWVRNPSSHKGQVREFPYETSKAGGEKLVAWPFGEESFELKFRVKNRR